MSYVAAIPLETQPYHLPAFTELRIGAEGAVVFVMHIMTTESFRYFHRNSHRKQIKRLKNDTMFTPFVNVACPQPQLSAAPGIYIQGSERRVMLYAYHKLAI